MSSHLSSNPSLRPICHGDQSQDRQVSEVAPLGCRRHPVPRLGRELFGPASRRSDIRQRDKMPGSNDSTRGARLNR